MESATIEYLWNGSEVGLLQHRGWYYAMKITLTVRESRKPSVPSATCLLDTNGRRRPVAKRSDCAPSDAVGCTGHTGMP